MRRIAAILFVISGCITCAGAAEGPAGFGEGVESLLRSLGLPGKKVELIGATVSAGGTVYGVLVSPTSNVKKTVAVARNFTTIDTKESQHTELKHGDRVIFYSEDVDELVKVVDRIKRFKGPILLEIEENSLSWGVKGNASPYVVDDRAQGPIDRAIGHLSEHYISNSQSDAHGVLGHPIIEGFGRVTEEVSPSEDYIINHPRLAKLLGFFKIATPIVKFVAIVIEFFSGGANEVQPDDPAKHPENWPMLIEEAKRKLGNDAILCFDKSVKLVSPIYCKTFSIALASGLDLDVRPKQQSLPHHDE